MKKNSLKTGMPPGTLVHTGEEIASEPKMAMIYYDQQKLVEREIADPAEFASLSAVGKVAWLNIEGVHRPEVIGRVGDVLQIHPLVLEDITNTSQRSKVEEYEEYDFMVLRSLLPAETEGLTKDAQISIVFTSDWVVTFNEYGVNPFSTVIKRLKGAKNRLRGKGTDYLIYTFIDTIVDNYFLTLESAGEEIESVEDEIFAFPDKNTLQRLHVLKREMAIIRRAIWPLREAINNIVRNDFSFVREENQKYYRDVYDHTIQVIETIESFRDIVSGLFDIYLSSVSQRMNEVMKVLTIIATIFIPLTFIAGIYGMNFKYMPELSWRWGYWLVLAVMTLLGAGMAYYFKKKEWF